MKFGPDETNPFGVDVPGLRPKKKRLWLLLLPVILAIGIGLYLYLNRGREKSEISSRLETELKLSQIATMESLIWDEQQQVAPLLADYWQKRGKSPAMEPESLEQQWQRALQDAAASPTNGEAGAVLNQVRIKMEEIERLRGQIRGLESLLDPPHLVRSGDTHYQIALNFLTGTKKLSTEEAAALIPKAQMVATLLPGFKVWNFLFAGRVLTAVTQGEAEMPPRVAAQIGQERLQQSRDEALLRLNSFFYLVDSRQRLLDRNTIEKSLLKNDRLAEGAVVIYDRSIDLRKSTRITIEARDFRLRRFTRIRLLPDTFVEDRDFAITLTRNGRRAVLRLILLDQFRGKEGVIVVE